MSLHEALSYSSENRPNSGLARAGLRSALPKKIQGKRNDGRDASLTDSENSPLRRSRLFSSTRGLGSRVTALPSDPESGSYGSPGQAFFPRRNEEVPWLNVAYDTLATIAAEGGKRNWDGDEATAIAPGAIAFAREFLRALPPKTIQPEFAKDRGGRIGLDWDFGPQAMLALSLAEDGTLFYAALYGSNRARGREAFSGTLSSFIRNLLSEVVAIGTEDQRTGDRCTLLEKG